MLVLPIFAAAAIGLWLIVDGRPADASTMFLTAAAITVVTGVLVVPCRYTLLEDSLSIRCGLLCWHVPYNRITAVQRSRTLRSGAALSLCRVRVITDRSEHIISPKDREGFLAELEARRTAGEAT